MTSTPPLIINEQSVAFLCDQDPIFATIQKQYGLPANWQRKPGFETLSRIILEQQVSLESAHAAYKKLKDAVGDFTPENILQLDHQSLKKCYVSRQKATYLHALSHAVMAQTLTFETLHTLPLEAVKTQLTAIKGIGLWTFQVYALFCLQASDILPLGDIAVVKAIKQLKKVVSKEAVEKITLHWRPYRSAATFFLWHYYLNEQKRDVTHLFK